MWVQWKEENVTFYLVLHWPTKHQSVVTKGGKMDIRWQPVICYHMLLMRKLRVREKTWLAQGPRPMSISSREVSLVLGLYMVNSITMSRLPEPPTSWPLFYMMSVPPGTACKLWSKENRCEQGSSRRSKIWIAHSVSEALLLGVKTGPLSMKAVLIQIKFNYKYEKNPKWFKQDRCLFLSQIQSHLKVGNPGCYGCTTCQGHGLLLSCCTVIRGFHSQEYPMIQDGCYNSSHCNHHPVSKKEQSLPSLSEGVACTLTTHWPELSHMATSTCKEGWKM